jgi:hypothetical protein
LAKKKEQKMDIENQSRITFKLIHEKRVDLFRNGDKVGEIWAWIPSNDRFNNDVYPFSEKKDAYVEKNGIQICGFSEISTIWTCHKFKQKKDVVIVFKDNIN